MQHEGEAVELTLLPSGRSNLDEFKPWTDPVTYRKLESDLHDKQLELYIDRGIGVGIMQPFSPIQLPQALFDAVSMAASAGVTVGVYQLLKTWVDARNGRKLKIKVGDIEVEATQMKEEDVLRIFEMLGEKADRKKIRELLLNAGKDEGRPEEH